MIIIAHSLFSSVIIVLRSGRNEILEQISLEELEKFNRTYSKVSGNKIIENAIAHVGIEKFCLNQDVVNNTYAIFNVELPKSKIYDQVDSERCWIHAGVNLIKNNVAQNLGVEESEYALSVNFLAFLDKLEKSNSLYNRIIKNENFDLATELSEKYLDDPVYEGGYFEYFRALVNKYGIVPEHVMPDVESSKHSGLLTRLFRDKVKKDLYKLLEAKSRSTTIEQLYTQKERMLSENYSLLAKCLGELPTKFDYEYKNRQGECVKLTGLTPKEFTKKYLTINLDNLVGIANIPMYNKTYGRLYQKKYAENIYGQSTVKFLNMPIEVLKSLAIKSLQDGMPVYFGCEMKKMRDNNLGIMDSNLYNYRDTFDIDLLTKEEALSMRDITFQHVMLMTGVHLEDNKPMRWKVEDSYGDKVHKDGYYVMNDNFFEDFVIETVIDKKYLSPEQLKLLDQKPIWFEADEPI